MFAPDKMMSSFEDFKKEIFKSIMDWTAPLLERSWVRYLCIFFVFVFAAAYILNPFIPIIKLLAGEKSVTEEKEALSLIQKKKDAEEHMREAIDAMYTVNASASYTYNAICGDVTVSTSDRAEAVKKFASIIEDFRSKATLFNTFVDVDVDYMSSIRGYTTYFYKLKNNWNIKSSNADICAFKAKNKISNADNLKNKMNVLLKNKYK